MLRSFFLIAALGSVALAAAQNPNAAFEALQGRSAPNFTMTALNGKKITKASLKGKIVVLDFWATWCAPCKAASPFIDKLRKEFGKDKVVIIGADSLENEPGPGDAKAYQKEHGYSYLFTYDNDSAVKSFQIGALPAFAIIDQKGVVRLAETGLPTKGGAPAVYAVFKKKISSLLSKS